MKSYREFMDECLAETSNVELTKQTIKVIADAFNSYKASIDVDGDIEEFDLTTDKGIQECVELLINCEGDWVVFHKDNKRIGGLFIIMDVYDNKPASVLTDYSTKFETALNDSGINDKWDDFICG